MPDIKKLGELAYALIQEERYEDLSMILDAMRKEMATQEKKDVIIETTTYLQELKERLAGNVKQSIIPTGFKDIDDRIFGAVKGNIMTICARTGGGKTTLGLNIALNMLKEHKVGFISLEMTEEEIGDKIVSRIGRVRHSALTINKFKDREIEGIKMKANEIKYAIENLMRAYDCYNLETLAETIEEMANRGCEIVFVDRIGMIEAQGNSQPERIRNIMTKLKEIAITRNIAIVAMQQLNRQMDGTSREPFMYDIADGSAIEKISSPVLIMRKCDEGYTEISLYKTRRLNADKYIDPRSGIIDRDKATTLRLKDDLGFSGFKDCEEEKPPF